ncbi:MAG: chorismate mutase, partial [Planctomycetia bacterium]
MSKKAVGAPRSSPSKGPSLQSLRGQIDKLDDQLLALINERARLAIEVGRVKSDQGVEVFSPAREDEILQRMKERNPGPLEERSV